MPASFRSSVSRRGFLATTLAGAGAVTLSSALPETWAADPKEENWIDAHVHVWTPDTQKYPLASSYAKKDMQPPSFTPEELFSHCRSHGVKRIVLIQMSFYGFDNSYMLDVMQSHPGTFSGVAVIDENSRPAETMKKLADKGVRGFRIRPLDRTPDKWLAGEGMQAMWRCGAETGQKMCCLIDPAFLPSVGAMCEKHPETPVVIDHFGRVGIDGTVRDSDVKSLCDLAAHENVFVKVSAFYALGKKKAPYTDLIPMIRRLYDAYGPKRLMWASDCPFQVAGGHEYGPSIQLVRDQLDFVSDDDRQWLLRKTADQAFFSRA